MAEATGPKEARAVREVEGSEGSGIASVDLTTEEGLDDDGCGGDTGSSAIGLYVEPAATQGERCGVWMHTGARFEGQKTRKTTQPHRDQNTTFTCPSLLRLHLCPLQLLINHCATPQKSD